MSSTLDVLIVGAGGLGREVWRYALDTYAADAINIIGFLDDATLSVASEPAGGGVIVGPIQTHSPLAGVKYLVAIGDPETRAAVVENLKAGGAEFLTLVHPLAYVSSNAVIGLGCIVAPFSTIGAGAILEDFTHVHFYASAAHDTRIGPYASLSPYVAVNGQAKVGKCAFLGTRATVNPTKQLGDYARVTAGSIVYRDVPPNSIADGNPAKARPLLHRGPEPSRS